MNTPFLVALLKSVYKVICNSRKQLLCCLWLTTVGTCHGCHGLSVEIVKQWTFGTVLWFAGVAFVVWAYGQFLKHLAVVLRDVREGFETIATAEEACDVETQEIVKLGKSILMIRFGAGSPSPSTQS